MIQRIRDFLMLIDIHLATLQRLLAGEIVVDTATCGKKRILKTVIHQVDKVESKSLKIARIKLMRELTNFGLLETKEIVEEVWEDGKDNILGYGPIKQQYR